MEEIELMNMCMIEDGESDRVVVQRRIKGNWKGIAFPGGHIEPGESVVDSVIREVKEETGLTVSEVRLCGVKDWCEEGKRGVVFLFKTSCYGGELLKETEEGEVFWCPKKEILEHRTANNFEYMLKVFLNEELTENFAKYEPDFWRQSLY